MIQFDEHFFKWVAQSSTRNGRFVLFLEASLCYLPHLETPGSTTWLCFSPERPCGGSKDLFVEILILIFFGCFMIQLDLKYTSYFFQLAGEKQLATRELQFNPKELWWFWWENGCPICLKDTVNCRSGISGKNCFRFGRHLYSRYWNVQFNGLVVVLTLEQRTAVQIQNFVWRNVRERSPKNPWKFVQQFCPRRIGRSPKPIGSMGLVYWPTWKP